MNSYHKLQRAAKVRLHRRLSGSATALLLTCTAIFTVLGLALPSLAQTAPLSPLPDPKIVYVDWDATGDGNGTSWLHAYTYLQDALANAEAYDDIWVAEGVYYPDEGEEQTDGDRESSFHLRTSVEIYGGFAGGENSLGERNWLTNLTVLSGDLDQDDSTDGDRSVTGVGDNCYHVVTADGVASSAQLNGFVITGGHADWEDPEQQYDRGAGIYSLDASPKLWNLIIRDNWAGAEGGGMYNDGGSPVFSNVTFLDNYAAINGGGFSTTASDGEVASLAFYYNEAGVSGGGMYLQTSDGQSLSNLTFIGNSAETGGGLYAQSVMHSTLSGSTISVNTAVDGGGLYLDASDFELISTRLEANEASDQGGGIFAQLSTFSLNGVNLINNDAGTAGGGFYSEGSVVSLTDSHFEGNDSASGGGMYVDDDPLTDTSLTIDGGTDFEDNVASDDGGGLYVVNAPQGSLTSVTFDGNQAGGEGGGMFLSTSGDISPYDLSSVSFEGNGAKSGGGLYVYESSPELSEVSFDGNWAQLDYEDDSIGGGGLYLESGSDAILSDCTFAENAAATGGGMYIYNSNPELTNVVFIGNEAGDGVAGSGGGLWNDAGSPTLKNVLFSGNAATLHGGGMCSGGAGSNVVLTNLTFSGNYAVAGFGGGLYTTSPNMAIHNTVVWNNLDSSGTDTASASIWDDPDAVIDHSLIQNLALVSDGNLDGTVSDNDPLFVIPVDPATAPTTAGILSVKYGSPIVDAGDNTAIAGVALDLDGNPRIYNDTVDLGPYELQLACPPSPGTTRLYVDHTKSLGNTGVDWPNALKDLRDAFTLAGDCAGIDEIWVADGIYHPDEGVGMVPDSRTETYQLVDGVAVFGGFAGGEGSLGQRDWLNHLTVLSGDIDKNDTAISGVVQAPDDIAGANSYHVLTADGVGSMTVLDGFTITAGQANGSAPDLADRGGGLYNEASSPVLANLRLIGNYAVNGGGLANLNGSNSALTSIQFDHNDAASSGGAIYNLASSPTLTGTVFSYNSASDGGAIYNLNSSPTFTGTVLLHNTASSAGGAIHNLTSSPTFTNTILSANTAANGAALYNNGSSASLINALLSGNRATGSGAAVYNTGSSPILVNVTVGGNLSAAIAGGMFNTETSLPVVRNSIFWDNRDATGTGTARATVHNADGGSLPAIDYSLVQSLSGITHTGSDNLERNPRFTASLDPALAPSTAGDFTLGIFSPAIDAGNNALNPLGHDLAGDPRVINDVIDMGAYEAPFRIVYDVYLPVVLRNYP